MTPDYFADQLPSGEWFISDETGQDARPPLRFVTKRRAVAEIRRMVEFAELKRIVEELQLEPRLLPDRVA